MEVELVVDCRCHLGEAPLWHPVEKCLYWLDILRGVVFVYDPSSNTHHVVYEGEPVGGMTLQADGLWTVVLGLLRQRMKQTSPIDKAG